MLWAEIVAGGVPHEAIESLDGKPSRAAPVLSADAGTPTDGSLQAASNETLLSPPTALPNCGPAASVGSPSDPASAAAKSATLPRV